MGSIYPSAPTNLVATFSSHGEYVLTWNIPNWSGTSNITGYVVGWAKQGETLTTSTSVNGLTTTATGMSAGFIYIFGVRAVNDSGQGAIATAEMPVAAIPYAPTSLTVRLMNGIPILDWVAPTSNGWEEIAKYNLYISEVTSGAYVLVATVDASVLKATHFMAEAGMMYFYRVSAIGEGGLEGPPSNAVYIEAGIDTKLLYLTNSINNGSFDVGTFDNWVLPAGRDEATVVDAIPGFFYEKAVLVTGEIYQEVPVGVGKTLCLIASAISNDTGTDAVILSKEDEILKTIGISGYVPTRYQTNYNTLSGDETLRVKLTRL